MGTAFLTIIGIVFGGLLNMAAAVWAEHRKQAVLELSARKADLADWTANGASIGHFRSLKLLVSNSPSGWLGRWMRSPALHCQARITFHRLADGTEIFGRAMPGRWAGSPQPTPILAVDLKGNPAFFVHDPERISGDAQIDIYPGDNNLLDIAVRFEGEANCYGFNNESYFAQPIARSPQWKLGTEVFLVKVVISSTGQKCEGVFRLINDGPPDAFRLETTSRVEAARVS